jgi:hypothetical protein
MGRDAGSGAGQPPEWHVRARRGMRHRAAETRDGEGHRFPERGGRDGDFNVIVMPDIFEANRLTIVQSPYLLVEGPLQKYEGVIHVQARKIEAISLSTGAASSHDFK